MSNDDRLKYRTIDHGNIVKPDIRNNSKTHGKAVGIQKNNGKNSAFKSAKQSNDNVRYNPNTIGKSKSKRKGKNSGKKALVGAIVVVAVLAVGFGAYDNAYNQLADEMGLKTQFSTSGSSEFIQLDSMPRPNAFKVTLRVIENAEETIAEIREDIESISDYIGGRGMS